MEPEVHRRPQGQAHASLAGEEPVADVHGVLPLHEHDPLFEDEAVDVVAPHRQTQLEAELGEIARALQRQRAIGILLVAQHDDRAIRQP